MANGTRVVLFTLLLAATASAAVPVEEVGSNTLAFEFEGNVMRVPYFRNLALSWMYDLVENAVVLVHGSSRNGAGSIVTLGEAAALAGANDGTWLLVAPQFLIEMDIEFHGLPEDYLYWGSGGWKQGDRSRDTLENPRPVRVSSFAVMDSVLVEIAARCPNLRTITLAGHSAGGQFVQRFAAGSTVQPFLDSEHGVELSYVVANPSSYLYFDGTRVVPGTSDDFEVPPPETIAACPDYDDYKYGLAARNAYMSALSGAELREQYASRRVTVLLGELDTDPNHPTLDTTCPAALQGAHRFERGAVYHAYLGYVFGSPVYSFHETFAVRDVGHDGHDVFTSECGVARLFGVGGCEPVGVEQERDPPRALRISPNPFRGRTTITWDAPPGERCAVRVHDVAGRRVRTLTVPASRRRRSVSWDGRDASGRRLGAGVYFLRPDCAGREARRVVLLR